MREILRIAYCVFFFQYAIRHISFSGGLVKPVILVHGGAGAWDLESDRLKEGMAACEAAAAAGQAALVGGGSALDAVEAAVRILEDVPCLDAGRGSYLNAAGYVEMDALIMDG